MFDTVKFIIEIKEKPCIWNTGSNEFRDKHKTALAWKCIGNTMYCDWSDLSESEQNDKVKYLKDKKWRSIRDNYLKYIKEENSAESSTCTSNKKKYLFADILSFLKPTTEKRSITRNFKDFDKSIQSNKEITDKNNSTSDMDDTLDDTTVSFQPAKKLKKTPAQPNTTSFKNNLIPYLEPSQKIDPDTFFLLSLLPDYKKLNDSQKLDFRINTLEFLKKCTTFDKQ